MIEVPLARIPEEPGAVIPHAGIYEGGASGNWRLYLNLQEMKFILGFMFIPFLASCFLAPSAKNEEFESAPSNIDERLESALIEDYVIALPPFAYHEGNVEQFEEQVRLARRREAENRGRGWDYLFVNGDGCWPSKDFVLDRQSRTLRVRIYNWEPGTTDYTETMRRVPGGWMRGPQFKIKTAEVETQQPPLAAPSST